MRFGEQAVAGDEHALAGVEVVGLGVFHGAADLGVAHEEVHGSAEEIRQANQRADIRFDGVVFILVDRLLRQAHGVAQLGLGDIELRPKQPQVFQHDSTSMLFSLSICSCKRKMLFVVDNNEILLYTIGAH